MDSRLNEKPVEEIPAVAEYEMAMSVYRKFREDNAEFFKHLDPLLEHINNLRQAAEKAARGEHASCGSFQLYQRYPKYDVNAIYDAIGQTRFFAAGGVERTFVKREIDKKALETAIARKIIKPEEIESARTFEEKYHIPEPIVLP